ncbi:MAG: hypothetical protein CMJ46_13555 [Planctomyces sp.]|nr:hypothetical protein [Planctomyces sp.]
MNESPDAPEDTKPKRKRIWIIVAVALVLCALLVAGGVFATGRNAIMEFELIEKRNAQGQLQDIQVRSGGVAAEFTIEKYDLTHKKTLFMISGQSPMGRRTRSFLDVLLMKPEFHSATWPFNFERMAMNLQYNYRLGRRYHLVEDGTYELLRYQKPDGSLIVTRLTVVKGEEE